MDLNVAFFNIQTLKFFSVEDLAVDVGENIKFRLQLNY
jgi:hypothetical protein